MLTAPSRPLTLPLLLTFWATALTVAVCGPRQGAAPGSAKQAANPRAYFPPGQTSIPINFAVLVSLNEPSLFESSNDASVVSFRASFFSPVPTRSLAIRLIVNPDGSGQITCSASSSATKGILRTQISVSMENVDKFLQFVQKEGFWQMSSTEENTDQKTDATGRKLYVMDGAAWMLEGVRNGTFHYVYRLNPYPNPILAMECRLAKDLAKPADPVFSMPLCTSRAINPTN